jgi:hypothetical protein
MGLTLEISDISKDEAHEYLKKAGLEEKAADIYDLVGGRMAYLVAAYRHYKKATKDTPIEDTCGTDIVYSS